MCIAHTSTFKNKRETEKIVKKSLQVLLELILNIIENHMSFLFFFHKK